MSALAQPNSSFSFRYRGFTEVDLVRSVSRIALNANQETAVLEDIASFVLRLAGITGFYFKPVMGDGYSSISNPTNASALSRVAANGQDYGEIRIYFDPHSSQPVESPVRLAKFIGQQLGLAFHRIALQRERQKHFARLNALNHKIRRDKAVRLAAAILAGQNGIPHTEAASRIVNYAFQHRRPLLAIAESLIFAPKVLVSHAR